MIQDSPLVSIVTVVYNGVKTIEQTILSVLNQSYLNIEYLIIDGGSTDGTLDIVKQYQNRLAYWISEPDRGIYHAMNKGLKCCKGELIGIINSDDWYEPNACERVVEEYKKQNRAEGVYYGYLRVWKDNSEYSVRRHHHTFHKDQMIQHPTWFVSKTIYEKHGVFNDQFRIAGDFDLFQRFILQSVDFYPLDCILSNFRMGGISVRGKRLAAKEYLNIRYTYHWITSAQYRFKKMLLWCTQFWNKS
jgi:glycosyltransferase involved in cell wall biosynthesis